MTKKIVIEERIKELDCILPHPITVLPKNFENAQSKSDLSYGVLEVGAIKFLREQGIDASLEPEGERFRTISQFSEVQILQIFIDHVDSVIIGILVNIATKLFINGIKGRVKIIKKPNLVIYEGSGKDLKNLPKDFFDLK